MKSKLTVLFAVLVLSPAIAVAQPVSPSNSEDCCDETDNNQAVDLDRPLAEAAPPTTEPPGTVHAAPAYTDAPEYRPPARDYDPPTAEISADEERTVDKKMTHGFRVGWGYIMNIDRLNEETGVSLKEQYDLKSASSLILGYEAFYRLVGHSWLNVIFVANFSVAGVEQSKVIPIGNGLIGFEFDESFQLGVGVNLVPVDDKPVHMIAAAGWTPNVGEFQMPIHFYFVPDVDKNHRMGTTIGVNW